MLNKGNLEPEDRAGITQNLSMLNVTWDTTLNRPIYSPLKYGLGRGGFVLLTSYLILKNKGEGGVGGRPDQLLVWAVGADTLDPGNFWPMCPWGDSRGGVGGVVPAPDSTQPGGPWVKRPMPMNFGFPNCQNTNKRNDHRALFRLKESKTSSTWYFLGRNSGRRKGQTAARIHKTQHRLARREVCRSPWAWVAWDVGV